MLRSISQNNLEVIQQYLSEGNFDAAVIVDYADNLDKALDFLVDYPSISKIVCLTEKLPAFEMHNVVSHITPWSSQDYDVFLNGTGARREASLQAIYDGDEERLKKWRKDFSLGPFLRVHRFLERKLNNKSLSSVLESLLKFTGLFLQKLIPSLRRRKGRVEFMRGKANITIFFDNGPEKDHYGENPLLKYKYEIFHSVVEDLNKNSMKTAYFFITGPRQIFIRKLLDLQPKNFMAFATALFRPQALQMVEKIHGGTFLQGTNISKDGDVIYSDHCLSVGAGEKELWVYSSVGGARG